MSGQMLVNGLINASLLAPPAIAFSLLFGEPVAECPSPFPIPA